MKVIQSGYEQIENGIYFNRCEIKQAHVETFKVLGDYSYGKDKNYVYHYSKILKGEKPNDFVPPIPPLIQY